MESSRDSSVWRNLAVTFGGGLALGAVGMKLTQTALRPVEFAPRPEPNVVTDRLSVVERRLERMEQPPAPPRVAAANPGPAAAPIDQKVLEAVIGAVDARLHEHAGQVDRRFADLEARLAVSQQQDRQTEEQLRQEAVALRSGMEQELRQLREGVSRAVAGHTATAADFATLRRHHEQQAAEMRSGMEQELRQLREGVSRVVAGQTATEADLDTLRHHQEQQAEMRSGVEQELRQLREGVSRVVAGQTATEADLETMRREYRQEVANLRGELEQSVETRFVTNAAAAAAARMEEQLAPLRAEVQQKEKELAQLRQRLAESEGSVLEMVLAIGDVCRQAADRIGGPRDPKPAAAPPAPAAPLVQTHPTAEEAAPAPNDNAPMAAPTAETLPAPQAVVPIPLPAPLAMPIPGPTTGPSRAIPDFLRDADHRVNWRVPLVSSILVSTGYLVLMHYLSASLQ
jgi:protein tyrosine phosphatase (PTP) superfamily phosphohydrolase (DUF442 family)